MTDANIQKVLNGDAEAFRFIINQHKDRAYALAMSVVKNEFTAKDVVQTAFVKAYTKLNMFKGDAKFSTWLHRIVINEAFKTQGNQPQNHSAIDEVNPAQLSPETNKIFSKMDADHQRYYINEALKNISAKYSLALRLFYLQEYSVNEVSEVTGWSNSNTKVILHRSRNKMKEVLSDLLNIDNKELY